MYESFYGLTALPFTLSPNPDFFYESKGHRSARSYLDYRVSHGEGIIVLTGEVGAGKTTLLRALVQAQDPKKLVVAHLVNSALEADDLLQSVALAFGIPQRPVAGAALLWRIEEFLHRQRRAGRRALLIVDEAQNLTADGIEHLHALVSFKTDGLPLLKCLLVGQPELQALVKETWARFPTDAPFPTYHLGPMEPAETRAYIEHRLRCVGWAGGPLIDSEAFALIHRVTGGVPRRINSLCNRLLVEGYINGQHQFGMADVDSVALSLSRELGAYAVEMGGAPSQAAADAVNPQRRTEAVRSLEATAVTAQLDRLERNAAHMLKLVRQIPGPGRPARRGKAMVPGKGR